MSYIGPRMPYLRMQGQWLDRAGFAVGTPVRVEVSERRLVVEAGAPECPSSCAKAASVQEAGVDCREAGDIEHLPAPKCHSVRSWPGAGWYSDIERAVANGIKDVLPRERRRERVSERALAERVRISLRFVRNLERGVRLPSVPVLIVLAWALDLDPCDLLRLILEQMNYPEGARPVLAHRAAPDLPRENSRAVGAAPGGR